MANLTTLLSRPTRRPVARAVEGQEIALVLVLLALWTALSLGTDTFLTASNLSNLLYSVAPVALVGIGMTAVIVTGGIDVSVGSAAAGRHGRGRQADPRRGCGTAGGGPRRGGRRPARWASVNGALISFGGIHPIIATFGTLNLYRFLALRLFENKQVSGVPGTLSCIGGGDGGETLGVPNAWWITMLARRPDVVLLAVLGHRPALVRHRERLGGRAARRHPGPTAGRRRPTPLTGLFVGLAGVVLIGSRRPRPAERRRRPRAEGDRGRGDRRHQHPRRPGHGPRHPARRAARRDRHQRDHPAGLAQRRHRAVHRGVHPGRGRGRTWSANVDGARHDDTDRRRRASARHLAERGRGRGAPPRPRPDRARGPARRAAGRCRRLVLDHGPAGLPRRPVRHRLPRLGPRHAWCRCACSRWPSSS